MLTRLFGPRPAPAEPAAVPPRPECLCCGRGRLRQFEECLSSEGEVVTIEQCTYCGVLTNTSSLTAALAAPAEAVAHQADGLESVYSDMLADRAAVEAGVAANLAMLDDLLARAGRVPRGAFLDVGAGAGHMSLAAAQRYGAVTSVDLRPDLLEVSARLVGRPSHLRTAHDLDGLGGAAYDCIFLWHVLEHVPDNQMFLRQLRSLLSPDGIVLLQVPLYRPAYVMAAHHHHHNARSIEEAARNARFGPPQVLFDTANSFMTAILVADRPS